MLKNVVFPAPFGPIRLTIAPSGIVKVDIGDGDEPAELLANLPGFEQVGSHQVPGASA